MPKERPDFYYTLKELMNENNVRIKDLNDELNRRHETNLTSQNLSIKLTNNLIKYREMLEILDILGYDIVWKKRGE